MADLQDEIPSVEGKEAAGPLRRFEKRSFNLPTRFTRQFDHIAALTGAASDTEVVKDALKAYLYLVAAERAGHDIMLRAADGTETRFVLVPIDENFEAA